MTVITEVPGSLEAEEILLTGLKIKLLSAGRPIYKCGFKRPVYPISVERGKCSGEISKENAPLVRNCDKNSNIDLGSKIIGQNLWGFSSTPLTRDSMSVGGRGRSARHSGQEHALRKNCFVCLIHGFIGDALSIHPSGSIPSEAIEHNPAV